MLIRDVQDLLNLLDGLAFFCSSLRYQDAHTILEIQVHSWGLSTFFQKTLKIEDSDFFNEFNTFFSFFQRLIGQLPHLPRRGFQNALPRRVWSS
jgi:hypothetical protein